jgi:hypothetical protein
MRGYRDVAAAGLDEALESACAMPYTRTEAKALWAYGRQEVARSHSAAARKRFEEALTICNQLGEGLYRKHIERDLGNLEPSNVSSIAD